MSIKEPDTAPFATVKVGDSHHLLDGIASETVHAVITDPPYGMTSRTEIHDLVEAWLHGERYESCLTGYAATDWDNSVPGPLLWEKVWRTLVPGGHLLAFGAARTIHLTALAVEMAGFEVRDTLHWTYGHSRLNYEALAKSGDRAGFTVPKQLASMRAGLRPGHEPIVVARKPLEAGITFLETALEYGTGGPNHDALTTSKVASNLILTHDLQCTPSHCWCQLTSHTTYTGDTEVFPGLHLPSPSVPVAKPTAKERPPVAHGMQHPTTKPLALMRALIRAYTQPGHTILDPFLGSGTTAEAALLEGRNIIGYEASPDYLPLIEARLQRSGLQHTEMVAA